MSESTHRFIGPTTRDGLKFGALCRVTGKKCKGKLIITEDGKRWLVSSTHLEKKEK